VSTDVLVCLPHWLQIGYMIGTQDALRRIPAIGRYRLGLEPRSWRGEPSHAVGWRSNRLQHQTPQARRLGVFLLAMARSRASLAGDAKREWLCRSELAFRYQMQPARHTEATPLWRQRSVRCQRS
jgi:hypothetical protein